MIPAAISSSSESTSTQSKNEIGFPDFVRPLTSTECRRRRWRHNLASWLTVPLRGLGRQVPTGAFGILMYHRVCPIPPKRFRPTYQVTPQRFGRQLHWLKTHGYMAWPLSRLVAANSAGDTIPDRIYCVTFDDGYQNNCTYALPILKQLKIPATVFVSAGHIGSDSPFPFDDWMVGTPREQPENAWLPACKHDYFHMLDSGLIELGAHTFSHLDFRERIDAFDLDLSCCLDVLSREFGITSPPFAYPFGDPRQGFASPDLAQVVRQAGCSCALQVGNSPVLPKDDRFHWSRFDVAAGDTGPSIAGKLDGWSAKIRQTIRSLRGQPHDA